MASSSSHPPSSGPVGGNPTYSSLASLRDGLRSSKVTDRRNAARALLEKLNDPSTHRRLEGEAMRMFERDNSGSGGRHRHSGGGGRAGGGNCGGRDAAGSAAMTKTILPWDRVCVLYRSLLDAALLSSRTILDGRTTTSTMSSSGVGVGGRRRVHANQSGFTGRKVAFSADDVLLPYRVFLRVDADLDLECNDGVGFGGGVDWKTRPRHGHHVDLGAGARTEGAGGARRRSKNRSSPGGCGGGGYHSTIYVPHVPSDDDRGSRLSASEVASCVDYAVRCLNDDDARVLPGVEVSLLQWLAHVCSRPAYLSELEVEGRLGHVLHEVSARLGGAYASPADYGVAVGGDRATTAFSSSSSSSSSSASAAAEAISQEALLAASKCLGAMMHNCLCRLGMNLHLFVRPVLRLVADWAEDAWALQSGGGGGGFATSSSANPSSSSSSSAATARNPHARMIVDGRMSDRRRGPRAESDVLSVLPYLFAAATSLLAAHPEQCVPALSECGHALLRLARRNYARSTTSAQAREAITEYVGAHLLVAETSGRMCGLPEGDLGPLVPGPGPGPGPSSSSKSSSSEGGGRGEEGDDEEGGNGGDDGGDGKGGRRKQHTEWSRRRKGATLDAESIDKLLEMMRDEKVRESLFGPSASSVGHHQDAKKKRRRDPRRGLLSSGRKYGGPSDGGGVGGGAAWTPLTRRQRRHLELAARLLRASHRLHLSESEDRGCGGGDDALESLILRAEEEMGRSSSAGGDGEIDILPREDEPGRDDGGGRAVASTVALARSPWIRAVGRHLYELNPKLGALVPPSTDPSSTQQDAMSLAMGRGGGGAQFSQSGRAGGDTNEPNDDGIFSFERILLESCPMLQSLVVDESALLEETMSAEAALTQGTLTASFVAPTPKTINRNSVLDPIRPTTVSTLQLLCACAESFPRGECWTTRQCWSTILDEGPYPDTTLANVLERQGSSPADAAAVVYLLGTTLESHGGSGGDEDIQLWTIVALLKMTESSAIICSREGLSDAATFGSHSSMRALRLAWQYVWKTLVRFDLMYSSYTSGAFGNNVGELVVQLLTQIIRYHCADREGLFVCRSHQAVETGENCLFIRREQGQLWKLPVFEDAPSLLSCAPFELITNAIRLIGFCDAGEATAHTPASDAIQMAASLKDQRYFVTFCLRFVELAMQNNSESCLRRSFLPYAATSLAAVISNGEISSSSTTYELDCLNLFAIAEDTEPMYNAYDPDNIDFDVKICINQLYAALWSDSITPTEYLNGMDRGIALRIVEGRGALLNRYLNAQYERDQLRRYMGRYTKSCANTGITPRSSPLGSVVFDSIKSYLDELLFQLKYEDGNMSDEDDIDSVEKARNNSMALPQVTALLSLMLTLILSGHSNVDRISQNLCDIFEDNFSPAFDLLVEKLPSLKNYPSDLLAVINHLHGIVRVLTLISAFGGGGTKVPRLFGIPGKSLFVICKSFLKGYRNQSCTSGTVSQAAAATSNEFSSDSDDGRFVSSQAQIQPTRTQHFSRRSNNSDDSDGLMDDDDDDAENGNHRPRILRAPPLKRRRVGNGLNPRLRNDSRSLITHQIPVTITIDARGAWACASLMLLLQSSFSSVEFIASHLIWPEDYNNQAGYGTVSKLPDPCGALVCATLFCRKSVILRRDRLDLQSGRGQDANEDQESALINSLEAILQARRSFPPSSKHFMRGLEHMAGMVKIGEYSECCGPISNDESMMVLEALHPEGVGKESTDYFLLRRWTKKILKYRSSYHSQQVLAATLTFIYAQKNLRKQFEGSIRGFMCTSFCHIDESVRSLACDLLGAALIIFPDQNPIVLDVLKNALPKLDDRKKIRKWVDKSLVDQKLRDEMVTLEEEALTDAEGSIEYNSIQCIGMIAGYASDPALARDMIWRLIDLATKRPSVLLLCYRACKRASCLLQYRSLSDMFDDMMPHMLVKWLESQRSVYDFPLLMMSPFALEWACRLLPNELLSMLLSGEGWSDDFFHLGGVEGEIQSLNERILTSFVGSVAQFLIPNILLSSSDFDPSNNQRIDATKYLAECVLILTGRNNDEAVAKVLCNHISHLYGYVAVLAEEGDATVECENAFKLLKRCVSSVHIERTGAKCSFLVLRHILLLHRKGMSVVGLGDIELTSKSYIEGIKYVSKQLKGPSNRKQGSFIEQLGSSMTESMIIVKYWLSSSQTERQREESWGTLSMLCEILIENIGDGTVESGELGFCLHSFISIILDPTNIDISPSVLASLNAVLSALFSNTAKETLVQDVISVIHKLSLALIQIHQQAYDKLYLACDSTLRCLEYEQKSTQGLLSGFEEPNSWDNSGEGPWRLSESDGILKHLITSKADLEEKVSSDTMLGAYGCLEMIANSGKVQIEDIVGADDIIVQHQKEDAFRNVNEKYSILTMFDSIHQRSTKIKDTNLTIECENFIRVLNEHPISSDEFESSSSYSSHAVLARLFALRRLERALLAQQSISHTCDKMLCDAYPLLLSICHSREPEQSRLISSRCLGELNLAHMPTLDQENPSCDVADVSLVDPILSIKKTILTSLGRFLLSDCADTSLVAMKTAKSLLVTPGGKECWQSLDGDVKGLLSPFDTHDDGKVRKEAVRASDSCMERLKSFSGCPDSDSWCWHDKLWTLSKEQSYELWIREITCSIISCSVGKGSKISKSDQDFFRICQGLCAREARFASSVFPALIFHLLDSEARDKCGDESGVRDTIMSNIAIGSPTSRMNGIISHCFTRILSPKSKHHVASQATTVILNTLELLRAITEHRFLTSPEHTKNKKSAFIQKDSSSLSKKRRSSNLSDSAFIGGFESSHNWRGFPYGVVLRVSGLDVAQACFRVKRYHSALYYAEMAMNNSTGTGTFLEDTVFDSPVQSEATVCDDISGFGVLSQIEENQKCRIVLEKALIAKNIIGRCLSELNAKDELQGILSQGSALNLKRNITSLLALEGCRRDQPFSMLSDLDTELQISSAMPGTADTHAGSSWGCSTIASFLEDLGLNHIKRNYLVGVESNLGKNNEERLYLREKWFEDSLNKTNQWDSALLPRMNDGDWPVITSDTHHHIVEVAPGLPSLAMPTSSNFHESVYESLQSFFRNDATAGLGHVLRARHVVLEDMKNLAGSEAQSTGMVPHIAKLSLLGHLELLATTLEGKSNLSFLLTRWGYHECLDAKTKLEALLMSHDVGFDVKYHTAAIDGALFRATRTESSVKEVALKILAAKLVSSQEVVAKALTSHIYKSCSIYRELGYPGSAKVSLSNLRCLMPAFQKFGITDLSSGKLPLMLRVEDARIMRSQNDLDGAIMTCKMIANHLTSSQNGSIDMEQDQILAESLLLGGLWMAQNNVDSTETILSSFFEKAAGLAMQIHKNAPSNSSTHRASIACFKLGEFAANLYNSIDARVSSDAWRRRNIAAQEKNRELQAVTSQLKELQKKSRATNEDATVDMRIIHATLSKEVQMDERELKSVEHSIQRYLQLAVESYCNALKIAPPTMTDVSKHVFQLISIWFKNCQRKGTEDIVNVILKSSISQIPSYRLIPLTYQLFSRIDAVQEGDKSGFQNILREIVCKICSEHPYHGIVQILALSNGQRIGGGVNGRHANAYLENVGTSKVDAVNGIIQDLRKRAPEYVSALIDSYEKLMSAYMSLAEYDVINIQKRSTKGLSFKQYKLDLDSCLSVGRRGKRNTAFTMPAIITETPPIRPDAYYGQGKEDPIGAERVLSFEPTFDLTDTGLHRPKIVICIGSKGGRFKQLVKGEDDLRQDAIMQQVFGTVNDLLRHEVSSGINSYSNSSGLVRRLRLITYGVTPLSPTSGVLEWVDNTMCFGEFLSDRSKKVGAHSKYYPGEWGANDVRDIYRSASDVPTATLESKRQAFDKICENFSPAFRFFFLEYFKSSMEAWHTARTLYTRSCAVNSIVGHILGIGDRHTSNILVHTKTGEVVHIDFGIVFEQGKTLTTPELVPFRLTRDVVDGMGPSGTDGVFSAAGQATMSVMRSNADTLLTILSAVVSDPLYKWSLSPLMANQRQRNDDESRLDFPSARMSSALDENRNDAADRAIAKIHEKLQGYEDGTAGEHKTIAGQVKMLINEARDRDKLCVMFAGWAPWM